MSRCTLVLFALLLAASCSSEIDDKPAAAVQEAAPVAQATEPAAAPPSADVQVLAIDPTQSKFEFVGAKVTGDHRGKFEQFTGSLGLAADGSVAKLDIEIETASLAIEPERLLGHLKSADFFEVETYPTARFTLDKIVEQPAEDATHVISGQLELHGVRKQIEFPAKVTFGAEDVSATALFTINRKDFGIVYPGKPDDLIKDDVLLDIALRFPKS